MKVILSICAALVVCFAAYQHKTLMEQDRAIGMLEDTLVKVVYICTGAVISPGDIVDDRL